MIALKFGLPLVRDQSGHAVAFDSHWLRMALIRAAVSAGYQSWWVADELVEGITLFLKHDYTKGVIDLLNLERAVRTVLCEVGYEEVAARFSTPLPYRRISLVQCLREIPQNNRAGFFEALAQQIEQVHRLQSSHVHFSDLHACVRGLRQLHSPTHRGDEHLLLPLVVAFVRDRVQSLCWPEELRCSIS